MWLSDIAYWNAINQLWACLGDKRHTIYVIILSMMWMYTTRQSIAKLDELIYSKMLLEGRPDRLLWSSVLLVLYKHL